MNKRDDNRLKTVFAKRKAFIPFITAGDPSLAFTKELVLKMAEAGADLIELGVPFSDPIAEGPVIQGADNRALAGGTTTDKIFDLVKDIRQVCSVPMALMTYINPVFTYGAAKFMENCRKTGVDAVIVPDAPYEERGELLPFCLANDITYISMIAPSSKERISMIAKEAQGFIYCVSSMGVTGMRREISDDARQMIQLVKEIKDIPCAVGLGIATPKQAAQIA